MFIFTYFICPLPVPADTLMNLPQLHPLLWQNAPHSSNFLDTSPKKSSASLPSFADSVLVESVPRHLWLGSQENIVWLYCLASFEGSFVTAQQLYLATST